MRRAYKVWVEIEELDAKGDPTGNNLGILPDSLGSFASLKKATAKVAEVVREHGIDPENSDSVKADAADPQTPEQDHKCFGLHSRILTQANIDNEPWTKAKGRRAGCKQIAPGGYGHQESDFRTRAERRNAAERRQGSTRLEGQWETPQNPQPQPRCVR